MREEIRAQLEAIFHARSVAVVGASEREGNFGRMFTQGLLDMGLERIYPVNPAQSQVLGLATYPSVAAIPDEVDLAILAIPAQSIIPVVEQCSEKGLRGIIVYAAGFAEKGAEGRRLEEEMVRLARRNGTRVIGPNCMGIYCPEGRLAFSPGMPKEAGSVGLISHSGSLTSMITAAAAARGVRFSKAVSCGNEADLHAGDFLEYLGDDPKTRLIAAYLEGTKDGRRFFAAAGRISQSKPIIVWKGGITQRGARAATSHTGALAGSAEVWRALFRQTGIVAVEGAEELVDTLSAFYHLPPLPGRRVAIVSGPGGPAVSTSDACVQAGLELAELSPKTQERIAAVIPTVGTSVDNPLDLGQASGRNPAWYVETIKALGEDGEVDALLIIGGVGRGPGASGPPEPAPALGTRMLAAAIKEAGKPAAIVINDRFPGHAEEREYLQGQGLPTFADGRRAAQALGKLADYADFVRG